MNQTKWLAACGIIVTTTLLSVPAPQARAAAPANDNPCNSSTNIYNNLNTGTGFAAWTNVVGSYYYGGSGISGDACTTHDWGMFDGGGLTSCQRPFTAANGTNALQVGQTVTNDMENGGINTADTEGFSLWSASGSNVFEMYFIGGGTYWTVADGNGNSTNDAIPYAGSGCRVIFTLTSASTYSLKVQIPVGGTTYGTFTGPLASPSGGQAITQMRWFTSNIGSGHNLQIGQMEVTCPDALTFTEQPSSETVPTNDAALFTVDNTGDSVTYQWQSSATSNGTYSAISGATNSYSITDATYESKYAVTATSGNSGTWYRCIVTDACGNTATSSAAQVTLSSVTAPVITTPPANTAVCSNSAATFSVTASGTSPAYDWLQHANAGWGSGFAWSVTVSNGGSGVYLGSSTNNESSVSSYCTGFGQDDINSPKTGNALGMFGPVIKVQRIFPSTLTAGQWFSIDMDNGAVDTAAQNGFSLHTGLPNTNGVLFSFYFLGGQSNYKFFDATGEHDTGIAFTRTGLRIQMLVGSAVGGTNTYSLFVSTNECSASSNITNVFSGAFETNGPPGAVLLYNNNAEGGSTRDMLFNNLIAGGAYDNADNYSAQNWALGGNGGDLPISGATSSSYTVNNSQSNNVVYYAIVTNAAGAVVSSTATNTIVALPNIYNVTGGGGYCAGGSGVSVTLSSSAAAASNITYYLLLGGNNTGTNWAGTGSALTTNVTAAGAYTIVASNATTGCTQLMNGTATVTINPLPTFIYGSQNNTQCGGTNGSITVTASGGSGSGYEYSDNNGATFQSSNVFTGLVSGAYEVVVEDSNGCISSPTFVTISDPNGPGFTYGQVNETCSGGASGSITVTASGGSGGYQYSDDNGNTYQPGNTFSGLAAGSYTIVVEDSNGCKSGGQVVIITQPSAVTFATSQTNETCNGGTSGSIAVMASGGSGGYQYSDNNGSAFQAGNTFSGLSAGTYQIVVEDSNGCLSATTPVTITQPTALSCSVSPAVATNCAGSAQIFTVNATGGSPGYAYNWTGPNSFSATSSSVTNSDVQPADAGTYTVTVTDTNGCQSICTATLAVNVAPSISASPTNLAVCADSTAQFDVTASGTSLQYFWRQRGSGWGTNDGWTVDASSGNIASNGAFIGDSSLNSGGSGTHSNINSSSGTAFGLYANNNSTVDVYRAFGSLAVGSTIQVDIENGYIQTGDSVGFGVKNSLGTNLWEFYFSGGASEYTLNDGAGANPTTIPYTANGLRITFTLTSSNTYSATIVTPATGGSTYTLSGTLITPLGGTQVPAELHFWNANAGDGCLGSNCSPYDYFFNNLFVGGVPETASIALYSDDAANYTNSGVWTGGSNLGQGPIAYVLPGSTEFSGANTATLTINPATSIDASNYDVVVTNSCGAARSTAALLTVNALPNVYTVVGGGAYCSGGNGVSVTLSNSDVGVNYQLEVNNSPAGSPVAGTGSALTFSNQTAAGTYTIVADNATTGCSSAMSGSATVTVNPTPSCSVTPSNAVICAGGSQVFTVNPSGGTPGYTYLWSDGSTGSTLTTNATGTYSVTVTDSNGCTTSCSATLTVNPLPTVSVNSESICAGGSATLTASTSASSPSYLWSPGGATTASITVSPAPTTIYTVTVTDGSTGCANSGSGTVTVNPLPSTPTAGNNGPICGGSALNLTTPTVAGATYSWTGPNSFTSSQQDPSIVSATTAASGTYLVTVTDSNGCTSAAGSTTATVNPLPSTPIAGNNGPILEGNTLNLTASAIAGVSYSWTGPNSFASTNQDPSISNATSIASGVYLVAVTDSNGCTSVAGSTTALVTALRITSITSVSNDIHITWLTTGGVTNAVQATPGNPGYNTNFVDISGPILILGSGDTSTNYVDVGGATNSPARFYRVRLVP